MVDGYTQPFDGSAAVVHHLDGDDANHAPENLVAAHHSCHSAHHGTKKGRLRTATLGRAGLGIHRKRFLAANQSGPWVCYFCDGTILAAVGLSSQSLVIHHLDDDRANNDLANLVAAHHGCHVGHHATERWSDADYKAKLNAIKSAALKGHVVTPEARAKISAALTGRPLSAEHRAKLKGRKGWNTGMSLGPQSPEHIAKRVAANTGKKRSPEFRAKMSVIAQNRSAETRAKLSVARKGKALSAETRAKISVANQGRKLSAETRSKISAGNKGKKLGRPLSPEQRAKLSATLKSRTPVACRYCGRGVTGKSNLARHERACPSRGSTDISFHEV